MLEVAMDSLSNDEVNSIIEKVTRSSNPQELSLKGLYFGRLCFKTGNYSRAIDWIVKYLRKFDRDFQAYRLLGECYEKISKLDLALSSYKQSLQLKPHQYDLILRVAELFLTPTSSNLTKAQVWLDKAAAALPGDPDVFKLKMELLTAQEASPKTIENFLLKELKLRPSDPSLRIQYVNFLKTQERLKEAFDYCNKESNYFNNKHLDNDYHWLTCLVDTSQEYMDLITVSERNIVIFCLLLEAMGSYIRLCIAENKHEQALKKLSQMDHYLLLAINWNPASDWNLVIEELKGQFSWLVATHLIHQAQSNKISWKEANQFAGSFYSYSLSKPLISTTSSWAASLTKCFPKFPIRLHKISAIRVSECSHMTWILNDKLNDDVKKTVKEMLSPDKIGKYAHNRLFDSDPKTSFLCAGRMTCTARPVITADMLQYDELAALSGDLHMLIWLGLQWAELEEPLDFFPWSTKSFPSLNLDVQSSSSNSIFPAISLLDVETFIAGCVFSSQKRVLDYNDSTLLDPMCLLSSSLPIALCRRLTTPLQQKWWKAATELTSKQSKLDVAEAAKLKPILQRGLECVRGVGNHGLDTLLLTKLAQYFASKAFALLDGEQASSAWFTYQRKASNYWSLATPELSLLSQGQTTRRSSSKDKIFPSVFKEPSNEEAGRLLSEAYMCRGELAARENRFDDALTLYSKAAIPQASFSQAHIYRKLIDSMCDEKDTLSLLVDSNRKRELLTKKYRHCLEVTLTRLQQYPDDRLHEKTIQLLRSPHVSPPRYSMLNKSINESVSSPSKQSTPKADTTSTSDAPAPVMEKEAVNNLVDTITTLTSALSSLQLEMEYLREENRLIRQSSPAQQQGDASMKRTNNQPQVFTSSILHADDQQRFFQAATPQRPLLMPNPLMMQSYQREGFAASPAALAQFYDAYQQQNATFHSPSGPVSALPNYVNPQFTDSVAFNSYGMPGYGGLPQAAPPVYPNANVGSASSPAPNVLAAALQNKDKEALQQKFSSLLAGAQVATPNKMEMPQPVSSASNQISFSSTPAFIPTSNDKPVFTQTPSTQNKPGKGLLQQLLTDKSNSMFTTPVVTKEIKQNLKVDLPPLSTPANKQQNVQFLDKFVSPVSPGTNMKFQSPEQMDRENQALDALEQADADTSQNADSGPHFDPIIPLPDLVEVKTGEEEEEVLFEERSKLFRWDKDQWKERGLGVMKLLRHKSSGKARLVMRREQVLKVCCNHYVTNSIHLTPMSSCNRAMVWIAFDFADGEEKNEKFAAKFRSVEIAEKFRDVVHVEASKQGETEEKTKKSDPISAAASKFNFSMAPSFGSASTPASNTQSMVEPDAPKPSPFGHLASALSSSGFGSPGTAGGGIRLPVIKYNVSKSSSFNTDASSKQALETSPQKQGDNHDHNTSGPHFEPIIDLPDLVEVKSGEEDEEVLFSSRAKLFVFAESEFKERGLGDMKILRHLTTGRYRIVMRREQVLKLCANHRIFDNMKIAPQGASQKSWMWLAFDFSESSTQEKKELFAIKFKTVEEAKDFHDKFVDGVTADRERKNPAPTSSVTTQPMTTSQAATAFARKELRDMLTSNKQTNETKQKVEAKPLGGSQQISTSTQNKSNNTNKANFGFNLPPKPAGSWSCPDCCVSNPADALTCPCCTCPNPNAPKNQTSAQPVPASKNDKFVPQFGTGMTSSNVASSKFSFGIPTSAASESQASDASKQHPALERVGVSKPGPAPFTQFRFGAPPNVSMNTFGSSPSFSDLTKSTKPVDQQSEEVSVPYQDEYEDETDTTETTESYSDSEDDDDEDDYDYDDNEDEPSDVATHQSPLSRFAAQNKETEASAIEKGDAANTESFEGLPPQPISTALQSASKFSFGSSSELSFGQLAASGTGFSFKSSAVKHDAAWKPDAKPMFSHLASSPPNKHDDSSEQVKNEDDDDIYVKPIIELPPPVAVETGEENETTLFSKRSKLYRWNKETSEWKERGIGEITIKHDTAIDRFRILMRREQVLKVCANHYITPDMKLEPSFGSEQAWTWLALDYADGEEKVEKLAAKFKNPGFAQQFKDRFEECQLMQRKKNDDKNGDASNVTKLISDAEKMKSELGYFKDKLSYKPNNAFDKSADSNSIAFDPNVRLTPLVKQHELNKAKGKSVDEASSEEVEEKSKTTTKSSLKLLDQFVFKFDPNSTKSEKPEKVETKQERNVSVCSTTSEEPDIHFEPIIPLPAKVAVQTGEENEQIVYEDRSKVYIFDRDTKQWKERGLGKIRLLQNLTNYKLRLVMRRDQVLKVCLNHFITEDITFNYKENSGGKVLLWAATDFSDPDKQNGEPLQFAMRFKDPESAAEFLRCVEDGVEASGAERLVDPVAIQLSRSSISEQPSEVEDQSLDKTTSPIKSPQKPVKPLFSFSNVDNPFNKKDGKFGNFAFGNVQNITTASENRFSFDASAATFNFGCATSTPMQPPVQQQQTEREPDKEASKSLFGAPVLGTTGVFKIASSSNVTSTQANSKIAAPSIGGEEPKLCIPGAAKDLRAIQQSTLSQPQAVVDTNPDNDRESSSSSESDASDRYEQGDGKASDGVHSAESDDDVIFVGVLEPNADQLARAEKLRLPKTFYLYENLPDTDWNSDDEDRVLRYIRKRDEESDDDYQSYDDNTDDNEDDQESEKEESESHTPPIFTTPKDEFNSTPVASSTFLNPTTTTTTTQARAPPSNQQPNLFQSFANMSDYSFSAMAAASDNKHAFGSRVDAAFQVSDEKKVLFVEQGEEGEEDAGEEHDPHYKPLLSELPPLVQVSTGEENEEVLFKERCKLYRFDEPSKAWKERGLGEMKILHHPEMDLHRVVMRREQVLKICANHRITKEMSLIQNSERAWMYVAQNQSEGEEMALEKLVVKFKNEQIAKHFYSVWEKARSQIDQQ